MCCGWLVASRRTLARSYQEDTQLDAPDQEKLQILETYLASAQAGDSELQPIPDAPMPTRAEDVDRFMAELVRATAATRAACPSCACAAAVPPGANPTDT